MSLEERVMEVLRESVGEINEQVEEEKQIEAAPSTRLTGDESPLDSLGLVSLIVSAEGKINNEFGTSVALVDATAMNDPSGIFRDLGSLRDHIVGLLNE